MLVLSRKVGEVVVIGGGIEITVLEVSGSRVKLGFRAPQDVEILRREIAEAASFRNERQFEIELARC